MMILEGVDAESKTQTIPDNTESSAKYTPNTEQADLSQNHFIKVDYGLFSADSASKLEASGADVLEPGAERDLAIGKTSPPNFRSPATLSHGDDDTNDDQEPMANLNSYAKKPRQESPPSHHLPSHTDAPLQPPIENVEHDAPIANEELLQLRPHGQANNVIAHKMKTPLERKPKKSRKRKSIANQQANHLNLAQHRELIMNKTFSGGKSPLESTSYNT